MLLDVTTALAGLGLFFLGARMLGDALKRLAGRRVRVAVARSTDGPLKAAGMGLVMAAVTQSTQVATFILAGMIRAALIRAERAMMVMTGVNVGVCGLLFVATFDVRIVVYAVIGLSGIAMTRARFAPWRDQFSALFGAGLLLFGLGLLRQGTVPIAGLDIVTGTMAAISGHDILVFLAAALLILAVQSSSAVGMIGISLAGAGLFGPEQAIALAFGANFGTALNMALLTRSMTGRARQLAMFQVLVNLIGTAVTLPLLLAESAGLIGFGPIGAIAALTGDAGRSVAWAFLLFNLIGAGLSGLLLPWIAPVLARIWPVTRVEADAQPAFLEDGMLRDPAGALDLAILEQRRLVAHLAHLSAIAADPGDPAAGRVAMAQRVDGLLTLHGRIAEVLRDLGAADISAAAYERLARAVANHQRLDGVIHGFAELAGTLIDRLTDPGVMGRVSRGMLDGIDAVVMTLAEVAQSADADERMLLRAMTGDRAETMGRIRSSYLAAEEALTPADRGRLLLATNLCERLFWMLGSLVEGLEAEFKAGSEDGVVLPLPEAS
ncbi:Na/Pi symporter [Tistrella mobilis]|uniref:Na/Pi cotransporter family protein n=1 Tax=Tistrella mobilis TaxID=171437 RepID=UPI003558CDE5